MATVLIAVLLVTVVAPVAVWALRRRGVLDVPGSRTLHEIPTARGGGLAVGPAVTIAALLSGELSVTLLTVVLSALALGVIGFVDDIRGLPALPRLGAQVVAGLTVAIVVSEGVVPLPLLSVPAGALACVYYINAFNFMDGINGISVAQTTVAGVHLAIVGRSIDVDEITVVGLAVTGAALAFAPWNAPHARLFLGDVGSYFLGFILAGTALVAVISGASVLLVVAPFTLYLVDTASTLVRRFRRGVRLTEAHREHAFQRLVASGYSHVRVSFCVLVLMGLSSAVVLVSDGRGIVMETVIGVLAWVPAVAFVLVADRRFGAQP